MRSRRWRQSQPTLTRPALGLTIALVLLLHALFALVLLHEMQPRLPHPAAAPIDRDRALVVTLIDHPAEPPVAPLPRPPVPLAVATPRPRPVSREPASHDAMVVQDHQAAPAPAASVAVPAASPLFSKGGLVRLPPAPAPAWAAAGPKAKPAKAADDRQIMQHDSNRMQYKATRFEKYFPPPNETAGGAVGRHIGNAIKKIADSMCDPKNPATATNLLCGAPPLPPPPKEGDERLNLPPPSLVGDPHAIKSPPLARCIAEYNETKPLSDGCPVNTPELAFKAELRVCIDLYRAGKRLKTWCPLDTPRRAAAEAPAPAHASSAVSH